METKTDIKNCRFCDDSKGIKASRLYAADVRTRVEMYYIWNKCQPRQIDLVQNEDWLKI